VIELAGKQVVVVGLGTSGVAAARLCMRLGCRVVANDAKPLESLSADALALVPLGAELIGGGHFAVRWEEADLVVVSPGVPKGAHVNVSLVFPDSASNAASIAIQ